MTVERAAPPGRRGWAIVAALSVTETVSWGVLFYGFTAFLHPVSDELGWSRGAMSAAFSLALLTQGAAAIVVGRRLDRHSPRLLMTAGSVAASIGVLVWSQVSSLVAFMLLWAAMGVVMSTILYEPAFTVVTKWFSARRRQALTVVTLVAAFASTIFLPLENWLIETYGWRQALVVLAVILAVVTVPLHALVLRPAPVPPQTGPDAPVGLPVDAAEAPAAADHDVRSAMRSASFWFLAAAFVSSSFVTSALAVHQVALLIDAGHAPAFAAGATGALGAMQLPGRLLFAPLERLLSRRVTTVVVFSALAGGVVVLSTSTARAAVWSFVVLYGMGRGMSTLLRATLVADLFGASHYGAISGVLSACTTVATAAGPLAAGLLFDLSGDYVRLLHVLIGLATVAVVFSALVERPATRPAGATRSPRRRLRSPA